MDQELCSFDNIVCLSVCLSVCAYVCAFLSFQIQVTRRIHWEILIQNYKLMVAPSKLVVKLLQSSCKGWYHMTWIEAFCWIHMSSWPYSRHLLTRTSYSVSLCDLFHFLFYHYWNRERTDKILIFLGVCFFFLCVAYVVQRRLAPFLFWWRSSSPLPGGYSSITQLFQSFWKN